MIYILLLRHEGGAWECVRQTYDLYEDAMARFRRMGALYGGENVRLVGHRVREEDFLHSAGTSAALNREYEDSRRSYREVQPIREVGVVELFRSKDEETET